MKFLYPVLCSLLLAPSLPAEPGDTVLSLVEVSKAVLANGPAIQAGLKRWNAARARVTEAAAWDDLRISADSRVARFVSIAPNSFTDQMLTVEQLIPISGKNRARARIAAAEALVAFEDVRRLQLDAVTKARSSYFQLANVYAQMELNQKNEASLEQIAESIRSKYEAGTATAAEVFVTETEASKLTEARRDLDRARAEAQSQLNVLMNRDAFKPLDRPAGTASDRVELSLPELRRLMLTQRPEIRMAQNKLEAEKAKLQLARRDWIPDPSVSVRAQRYNGAAQGASELDAGISFSVPWLNYRKYAAATAEAGDNVSAAEREAQRAQVEAIGLLRDQLQKIETSHHHVELFRDKIVPQARQAFDATQLAYESGKSGFLDWIAAERNLRDLESMARQHLTDYQVAVAELEGVVGADLTPAGGRTAMNKNAK